MSTEIIVALIGAVVPILGNIVLELIHNKKDATQQLKPTGLLLPQGVINKRNKIRKRNWAITILATILFAFTGYIVSRIVFPPGAIQPIVSVNPPATIIPRISKILEINFSAGDKTVCITEKPKGSNVIIGDYDKTQDNYFVIGQQNGFITYCNIDEYINQGSLEIKVDPISQPKYFGYGVIIGFVGGTPRDLCSFSIIKDGLTTSAVFGEYIEGSWSITEKKLDWYSLDTDPHIIRMVLNSEKNAVGYIDETKVGEHQFTGCSKGRIGFIAYGDGETKITFDDLKLFAVP